ncbi:MAG: nucleoside 2-deoxyribosyltransferase domain-containing protein [Lactobacillus sp.]|jgi:hypothetical protein|nr:nucleoside 2-deoxyribosyltransferase domain-containing protein [Lactobacillus sp.]
MKLFNKITQKDTTANTPSIFIAGPIMAMDGSRQDKWQRQALKMLDDMGYEGHIYVPELTPEYTTNNIDWEVEHLTKAKCIMFWIPRDLKTLPAFTSNIEFGEWMNSGKVVLGFPPEAENMFYISYRAQKLGIPTFHTLEETLHAAINMSLKKK